MYTMCSGLSVQPQSEFMIYIGRLLVGAHGPPLGQAGPSIAPENWHVGRTLPAVNCREYVFAMDVLTKSRLAFRQGQTVQPYAMVSVLAGGSLVMVTNTCGRKVTAVAIPLKCSAR